MDPNILPIIVQNRLDKAKGLHVYAVLNGLTQAYKEKREYWCVAKREYVREDPSFFDQALFSDESVFQLGERRKKVSTQNLHR